MPARTLDGLDERKTPFAPRAAFSFTAGDGMSIVSIFEWPSSRLQARDVPLGLSQEPRREAVMERMWAERGTPAPDGPSSRLSLPRYPLTTMLPTILAPSCGMQKYRYIPGTRSVLA